MQLIQKYAVYWPVLIPTLIFFGLGLWYWLRSEAAMERSPKPLSWVENYRKPGFPFRSERLPVRRSSWLIPAALVLLAVGLSLFYRYNGGKILLNRWISYTGRTYNLFQAVLMGLGAAALYYLLLTLYDAPLGAALGTVLFAVSPVHGRIPASCLALCLCLLVLWLRSEKPGFPGELLYLAACAAFALGTAISPAVLWLWPCLVGMHWYKLCWQLRQNRISFGGLALSGCAALAVWFLLALLAGALRQYMLSGFGLAYLTKQMQPVRAGAAWVLLWRDALAAVSLPIRRSLVLEPMMDAPLFGLGFWGLFSAGGMALKRRRVQGWLSLGLTAALVLLWLLTGWYGLPLALALGFGALFHNAKLGNTQTPIWITAVIGAVFSLVLALLAWMLPLPFGLIERLF